MSKRKAGDAPGKVGRPLNDLTGKRFGRLVVIERVYWPEGRGPFWLTKCDCGNEHIVRGDALTIWATRSCGCLRYDLAKERRKKHSQGGGGAKS